MRIFVLLCCLLAAVSAHAQLLRTTPVFTTETTSSITIFADATKGNRGIINTTGDIFVHIGAITSLSTSSSNWRYVPVAWGVADNKVKCTKLTNNVWSFTISGGLRNFFGMTNASEAIQKIAQEISPWLSEFKNDMILNSALFTKVKSVYNTRKVLNLDPEQTMLLEKQYKGFSRNGANLNSEDKEKLRKIDTELSKLSLQFGENVLADSNAFELHITHEKDLIGLPEGAKEAARLLAKNRNKEGWLITLDYPSYIPFITYAENRELRKKLSIAFGKKGFQGRSSF